MKRKPGTEYHQFKFCTLICFQYMDKILLLVIISTINWLSGKLAKLDISEQIFPNVLNYQIKLINKIIFKIMPTSTYFNMKQKRMEFRNVNFILLCRLPTRRRKIKRRPLQRLQVRMEKLHPQRKRPPPPYLMEYPSRTVYLMES